MKDLYGRQMFCTDQLVPSFPSPSLLAGLQSGGSPAAPALHGHGVHRDRRPEIGARHRPSLRPARESLDAAVQEEEGRRDPHPGRLEQRQQPSVGARIQLPSDGHRRSGQGVRRHLPPRVRLARVPAGGAAQDGHQARARHAAVRPAGLRQDADRAADREGAERARAEGGERSRDPEQVRGRVRSEYPRAVRRRGEGAGGNGRQQRSAHHHLR